MASRGNALTIAAVALDVATRGPGAIAMLLGGLAIAGCAPEAESAAGTDAGRPPDAAVPRDAGAAFDAAPDARPRTASGVFLLQLDAGAFPPSPTHPSALVYLPSDFDARPPLNVVVFLHGFNNCVENVVRDAGASCDVDAGTPIRNAYALAAQLEAAHKNALLICPEIEFDQASGNPGNLGLPGGFRAMLGEILADLAPRLGPLTVADLGRIVVASHSGGYSAAAGIAARGGVAVDELYLFDSLYGDEVDFDAWVKHDLASFAGSAPARRFADVYTCCGGTEANSRAMADRGATWVSPDAGVLVDDRTADTWPADAYRHGLLFKLSGLSHDGVPRYYFGPLIATSGLPDRR